MKLIDKDKLQNALNNIVITRSGNSYSYTYDNFGYSDKSFNFDDKKIYDEIISNLMGILNEDESEYIKKNGIKRTMIKDGIKS